MNDILVDTSVWVDHFRRGNTALVSLLVQDCILIHPLVLGELACGTPPRRAQTLDDLSNLRPARQASMSETIALIESQSLYGAGCGVVDILLLASALITPGATLWTLDRKLKKLATHVGIAYAPASS